MLAQQDTWQHAAEPSSPQARAQPGNLPADAALATGEEAAAVVSADTAQDGASAPEADDHAVHKELTDALVPAGADQSAAALVSQLLQHVTQSNASKAHYLPQRWQQALVYVCMLTPSASQKHLPFNKHIYFGLHWAKMALLPHKYHIMNSVEAVDHVSMKLFSVVMKMIIKQSTVIQHAYLDSVQFLAGS